MLKKVVLLLLFFCYALYAVAALPQAKEDSVIHGLQLKDPYVKEKKLISYLKDYFGNIRTSNYEAAKASMHELFLRNNLNNAQIFDLFIASIYHNRTLQITEAKNDLFAGIDLAAKSNDHYLLYEFLTHLAFIQTYEGNAIGAISSFRMAKRETVILNDAYLQAAVNVNISDIYYKYNFYNQSLYYLSQALAISIEHQVHETRLKNVIYYNISENYFRMHELDSLKKYNQKLRESKDKSYKLYTYIKRTNYYIDLLQRNYKSAINNILALQKDRLYKFEGVDNQNLANAYFNAGILDSAKYISERVLATKALTNHPEIKYHLYELLGEIAEKENDPKLAALNFNMALEQSKENIIKLIQVGDVAQRMKVDDVENTYNQQEETYKNERIWLILVVIVALLAIAFIALFYRNIKQKRHYEKLLFTSKKEEISFINSHNIRKHLSNILGIIDVISHSEDKGKEYLEAEAYLTYSAKKLDESIKNISEKLEDEDGE
jgi:hypothetical protein